MKNSFTSPGITGLLAGLLLISQAAQAQPSGYALSFNGVNNYVSLTVPGPPPPNFYTICAWVYLYSGGTYGGTRLAVLGGTGCGESIEFMIRSDTESATDPQYLELGRCSAFDGVPSTTAVPLNTWTHVAVTINSQLAVSYYINGNPAGTWQGSGNFAFGTALNLADNNGLRAFNGMLNNVQIWNTVLSQSQIQTYMSHPPTGSESGLYAYYPFREGSGTTTADAATAGSGSTGTLVNSPLWVPVVAAVTTLPATGVANPNTTLNGIVTNETQAGVAYFQWGLTTNYGNTTVPVSVGASSTLNFSNTVTGLASAEYHYRAVASNSLGIAVGQDVAFWPAVVSLNGVNPLTNECHALFNDPGALVNALPVTLACGYFQDLAVRVDGTVAAWGNNNYSQINVPGNLSNVTAVAVGNFNSMALKSNGSVVEWGRNDQGQIGGAGGVANGVSIAVGAYHAVAAEANGSVVAWGENNYSATTVPSSATNVIAVAAGDYHCVALRSNGTVVAWGAGTVNTPSDYTDYGQAIVPANATNVVAIAAGSYHSLARTANGTVLAWGAGTTYNPSDLASYGQCIVPAAASNVIAIAAGTTHSVALRSDGSVIAWGDNTSSQTNVPAAATNIVGIIAGGNHTFALRRDGIWIGWGDETTLPAVVTNLTASVSGSGIVQTNSPGTYVLTYRFTNSFGLVVTNSRIVVVADRTPPVLTLAGANPFYLTLGLPYVEPGYSAPDACQGDLTSSVIVAGSVNTSVVGTNIVTYSVTDGSGNTATSNRTIIVTSEPSIFGLAAQVAAINSVNGTRIVSLTATVGPNGVAGTCQIQYGLNTSYPGATPSAAFVAAFANTNLGFNISNLVAGVTYHFRASAANSNGTTTGSDLPFYIPSIYPVGDLNGDGVVDQNELNLVLSNYLSTSPYLLITNTIGLGQSNVTFALSNSVAGNFSVMVSTDLVNWQYLAPANPAYLFTDTNAPTAPLRYYRLRYP